MHNNSIEQPFQSVAKEFSWRIKQACFDMKSRIESLFNYMEFKFLIIFRIHIRKNASCRAIAKRIQEERCSPLNKLVTNPSKNVVACESNPTCETWKHTLLSAGGISSNARNIFNALFRPRSRFQTFTNNFPVQKSILAIEWYINESI